MWFGHKSQIEFYKFYIIVAIKSKGIFSKYLVDPAIFRGFLKGGGYKNSKCARLLQHFSS